MNNNSDLPGPMIAVFGVLILVVGLLTAGMVKSADEGTYRSPVRPHLRPSAILGGAGGADSRPVRRGKIARSTPSPQALSMTSPTTRSGAKLTALALAPAVCADTTTINHRLSVSTSKRSASSQRFGLGTRRKAGASSAIRWPRASGSREARAPIALIPRLLMTNTKAGTGGCA